VSLTGLGEVSDLVKSVVTRIWPDKTAEDQAKIAADLQRSLGEQNLTLAQVGVDQAEAASTDRLQHWRGALGWVCTIAYGWHYVGLPIVMWVCSVLVIKGRLAGMPTPPDMNTSELSTLLMGMLGLGAMHVTERVKGVS